MKLIEAKEAAQAYLDGDNKGHNMTDLIVLVQNQSDKFQEIFWNYVDRNKK